MNWQEPMVMFNVGLFIVLNLEWFHESVMYRVKVYWFNHYWNKASKIRTPVATVIDKTHTIEKKNIKYWL